MPNIRLKPIILVKLEKIYVILSKCSCVDQSRSNKVAVTILMLLIICLNSKVKVFIVINLQVNDFSLFLNIIKNSDVVLRP